MTKENVAQLLGIDKFNPDDPNDRIDVMSLLQELGRTEDIEVLKTVWNMWIGLESEIYAK